ncbi:MAG: PqqD family protein [Deltaproteobacteria bacterium]|nr:PqqD family protein [Deltaproteobacteria bacterium]
MSSGPRRCDDCAFNRVAGETVVVKALDGTVTVLNSPGGEIWEMCDGRTSIDRIVERLCGDYDAPPGTIRREVEAFIDSMVEKGMMTR